MNDTVNSHIYIIYSLIAIVLVLILILFIVDRKEKKKNNKIIASKTKGIEEVKEEPKEIPLVEPIEEVPQEKEIKYVVETPEEIKTEAQMELQRITKELEEKEDDDDKIKLTNFELEQEENAIISIHELMKKSQELYDKNEEVQYQDEGNEPINIEELKERFTSGNANTIEVNAKQPVENKEKVEKTDVKKATLNEFVIPKEKEVLLNKAPSKFKSSPFISPIYGIEKPKEETNRQENINTVETYANENASLDDEIRKTNEFLSVLKELKKNLE